MFKFKQFTVHQDRCAMKIGTDGVLLGAWAPIDTSINSILDIGTGTGIIALMLAQRSNAAIIDALEIDADAYEQAVENFEASPWSDRLFCYHASFQEFIEEIEERYDFLISNPPFFSENHKTSDAQRAIARFEDALPFEHLLTGASRLLSINGRFAAIFPCKEEQRVIDIARQVHFFPQKITRVKGTAVSDNKRSLLLFGFDMVAPEIDELVIENSRHQYTDAYIRLTKDFYLKM